MTIALAACSWLPEGSDGFPDLIKAPARLGVTAGAVAWDAPVDWASHELHGSGLLPRPWPRPTGHGAMA